MLHCGNGDIWPRVAAVANPTLFEDTGRHGTTIGNCEIVYHQFDHFYPLGGEYFREHIFPYLMDDVSPGRDVRRVQLSAPKLALSFALGKFLRTARFVWYCMGAFRNYLKR
jgi:hypothetical protein